MQHVGNAIFVIEITIHAFVSSKTMFPRTRRYRKIRKAQNCEI